MHPAQELKKNIVLGLKRQKGGIYKPGFVSLSVTTQKLKRRHVWKKVTEGFWNKYSPLVCQPMHDFNSSFLGASSYCYSCMF